MRATHTHKALCALAVTWLQRPNSRSGPGCTVALAETASAFNGEIPDAIGWSPFAHARAGSVVVEVKISRSDFLADAAKPHRAAPATGMGDYRYYLAPQGLIAQEELPPKWGFIEVNDRGHLKVRAGHVLLGYGDIDTWRLESNHAAEISLLALCLARVGDPQQVQERLREANNRNARLIAEHERRLSQAQERYRRLIAENARLRGEVQTIPTDSAAMPAIARTVG